MKRLAQIVRWAEKGESQQQAIGTFSADSGALSMEIWCDWDDFATIIPRIVGCSWVETIPPSAANPVAQINLRRYTPATHPRFPAFRATRIQSAVGVGPNGNVEIDIETDIDENIISGGTYGKFDQLKLNVLFEVPKYPIDADLAIVTSTGEAPYRSFVEFNFIPNIEQLARKGTNWTFVGTGFPANASSQFNGDTYLRTPKGILEATWYGVPENWVMNGRVFPTNIMAAIGKVNDRPFPYIGWNDTNPPYDPVTFPPGTLLLLPPVMTPSAMIAGDMSQSGNVFVSDDNFTYRPRSIDVKLKWVYFSPMYDPNNVTNVKLVRTINGQTSSDFVPIIGHNLAPLPYPRLCENNSSTYYSWYPIAKNPNTGTVPIGPISSDEFLLYRYANMESIFNCVVTPTL